jgi:hypothetical protein
LLLGLIYGLKHFATSQGLLTESKSVKDITEEVSRDIEKMEHIEEDHTHDDVEGKVEQMNDAELEILEKNKEPEYVIGLLFGAVTLKDIDLFASMFEFEQLNKDLFSVNEPDKKKVLQDMVSRISQQNTLTSINIVSLKQNDDMSVDAKVRLTFEGNTQKNIVLILVPATTFHEADNGIFTILTSSWDLIEQIEGE